ncbi:MAG: DUF1998 domain-containing protein, partial [Candidatus Eisenbacteria sp.]|nr:DUF1998 domain-containing protein [Candidatus Eisenbacteria bacterium]
ETCDYISLDPAASVCLYCGAELRAEQPILCATSFLAERAEAISADEEYRKRAFYTTQSYLLDEPGAGDASQLPGVSLAYHRRGEVMLVNEGLIEEKGRGFRLCESCGHWHAPTSKKGFEDHKLLHDRRKTCGGQGKRFHLVHRFQTDVLVIRFEGAVGFLDALGLEDKAAAGAEAADVGAGVTHVGGEIPDAGAKAAKTSREELHKSFYASLKAALIDAANMVAHAEDREIGGFVRKVVREGSEEQDLILYDRVPGGAGYVRRVADRFADLLRAARQLLDGCACERSCYRCLRSYANQYEHRWLDKQLIMPFLDHMLAINSPEAVAQLAHYGPGSRRFCGSHVGAWLQRRLNAGAGGVSVLCERIDNREVPQAIAWAAFLADYARKRPTARVALGLIEVPDLATLSTENFMAVKAVMDLLEAGVHVYRLAGGEEAKADGAWQMVWGAEGDEPLALAVGAGSPLATGAGSPLATGAGPPLAMGAGLPLLTPELETATIIYNAETAAVTAAEQRIRGFLNAGTRVTPESLKLPEKDAHRIVEIEDGQWDVTYAKLFREFLRGAQHVRIVDPYIRAEYQVRNLEQFADEVGLPPGGQLELVTMYRKDERYGLDEEPHLRARLEQLKERWAGEELAFDFSFDPAIHDRFIETEEWHIILGRGLDIYYPPEYGADGRFIGRRARACTIAFLPKARS